MFLLPNVLISLGSSISFVKFSSWVESVASLIKPSSKDCCGKSDNLISLNKLINSAIYSRALSLDILIFYIDLN